MYNQLKLFIYSDSAFIPRTSPFLRNASNSSFVLSSIARMSAMVKPCHWSIEQNTCLENNVDFTICKTQIEGKYNVKIKAI